MNDRKEKFIFIDRDGVINEDPIGDYVKKWEEFRFISGALEALKQLTRAGFEIIVVSNQAGVGDGVYPESALNEITTNMVNECKRHGIRISRVYYCLHGKTAGCDCRKPKTGLLKKASQDFSFDTRNTYFIGDKAADIQAGNTFGLRTIFVLTGHGKTDKTHLDDTRRPEQILPSIVEATHYVLRRSHP